MVKQINNYVKYIRVNQLETHQRIGHTINVLKKTLGKNVNHYHHKDGLCGEIFVNKIY